jgi:acid phosphatase family membrane protein YuiD
MTNLLSFLNNAYPLVAALVSLLISQILKIIYFYVTDNRAGRKIIFTSGGMPSSHSALVTGLTVGIGLQEGWTSSLFCIATVFSLVVLYDSAGIRNAVGKQAIILNQIVKDLLEKGEIKTAYLSEFLGHTPFEVLVGASLGAGIAFTLYY